MRVSSKTLWRRWRKVFARLFRMTEEWAARAGLYDLPDDFAAVVEAELRHHIAGPLLTPDPSVLMEQVQSRRQDQLAWRERMDRYKAQHGRSDAPAKGGRDSLSVRWQTAVSIALAATLFGLACNLALKGWLMLGLAAVIIILNLNMLPAWVHQCAMRLGDYYQYRRASAAFWRLERQIQQLRLRIEIAREQEDLIEKRIAVSKAAVMSYYPLHKNQALQAARSLTKP
jgi:hypothetical protein